jgi:hypothetical protein
MLLVSAGVAAAQSSQGERQVTETELTMSRGTTKYTTTTEQLRGRARVEVTNGYQPGGPGGYSLFDSTEFVTVDPSAKTFTRLFVPPPAAPAGGVQPPMSTKYEKLETSIDSTADKVDGVEAMRYTVRIASVAVTTYDPSRLLPGRTAPPEMRVGVTQTFEFWYPRGDDGGIVAPRQMFPPANELAAKTAAVFAQLPRKRPIRSITSTHTDGAGGAGEGKTSMRLVRRDSARLDERRFVIPAGFTEKPMFGGATADSTWLAKWMSPPRS